MRAANLVQDFKRTSADQTSLEIEKIALDDYIPRVCSPLKPMLRKEQVELSIDSTPDLVITTCPGVIVQILTNLISNAQRHAFGPSVKNGGNKIAASCSKQDNHIVINVTDNGKGIAEEFHRKVFEPFYTTARDKGGTGLGLHILYNLVRQKFNGDIGLISTPRDGTTVTALIPAED